jgi:general secretion pathway protein G
MFERRPRGFTLVEVLIVVVILGLLAAVVTPQFAGAAQQSKLASSLASMKALGQAFQMYRAVHGVFPSDAGPGGFPPEMAGLIRRHDWERAPLLGEEWDWNAGPGWSLVGSNISIWAPDTRFEAEWDALDRAHDDGSRVTGLIQQARVGGAQVVLIVE